MEKLTSNEIRNKWISFFESKGHKVMESAPLVPQGDDSLLFINAGVTPLKKYFDGTVVPDNKRIVTIQKCIRTNDLDAIGDTYHHTFFEMLGNWSLGDYFKKEAISWSFEFLTQVLNIPVKRLAVTVFAGNDTIPFDKESHDLWLSLGIPEERIARTVDDNFWIAGETGPCGPDSEMFYDSGKPKCSENCSPACDCGKYLEIWNDVFMQYKVENAGEKAKLLDRPNIDTGMGLERTVVVLNGLKSVYDAGIFKTVIDFIGTKAKVGYEDSELATRSYRIITDHLRSSMFILGDANGVLPSNVGQGYILRRFIRRAVNCARNIGFDTAYFNDIIDLYVDKHGEDYSDIKANREKIKEELSKEVEKFSKALEEGHKEFDKVLNGIEKHKQFAAQKGETVENIISGKAVFRLYDTFGFPFELTRELAKERGYDVDEEGYKKAFEEHQEKSRTASAGVFKGGLADSSYESAKLHTATHLIMAGLRKMFGPQVMQKGSNITPERLRIDFNLDHKMTPEELAGIEKFVNDAIAQKVPVVCEEMSVSQAKESGAVGVFESKYGEIVKVYSIGDISKEICGGPHAKNTEDLHHLKIVKEESSSSGVRRIKAVLD